MYGADGTDELYEVRTARAGSLETTPKYDPRERSKGKRKGRVVVGKGKR